MSSLSRRRALGSLTAALGLAIAGLGLAALAPAGAADAPSRGVAHAAPAMQAITATGIVTNGSGTCFPDAVLVDCDGNAVAQLKGPGGAGFFAPYLGRWVSVSGSEQTCPSGGSYLSVLTIQPETNPCPGGGGPGQATPTPMPGATQPPPPPPPTLTPTPSAPGQGGPGGDLALGKAIFASTTQAGYPAEWAIDGNPGSWWASLPGAHPFLRAQNVQWIYVDLGAEEQITGMDVTWTPGYHARGYAVMVWSDRVRDWVQIGSTSRGDGDEDWRVRSDVTLRARYVMLWLVNPYLSGRHYELRTWEIHGPASGGVRGGTNVALTRRVVAQSESPGLPAAAVTDGDVGTAWQSAGGLPQWLYVDFGSTMTIDRATLRWMAGLHATDYGLYAWNGRDWYGIFSRRGGTGGDEAVTFPTVRTRYVLLHATAAPGGSIGLRELEVYEAGSGGGGGGGVPPGPPTPIPFSAEGSSMPDAHERALPAGDALLERADLERDRALPGAARPDVVPGEAGPEARPAPAGDVSERGAPSLDVERAGEG